MVKTLKLVLWELAASLPGLLWLASPGWLQRTWHSPYARWLVVAGAVFYAALLGYWLNILLRGGWGAVVEKLEQRAARRQAAQSGAGHSPLGENITLAFVAFLFLAIFVLPVLLRQH